MGRHSTLDILVNIRMTVVTDIIWLLAIIGTAIVALWFVHHFSYTGLLICKY